MNHKPILLAAAFVSFALAPAIAADGAAAPPSPPAAPAPAAAAGPSALGQLGASAGQDVSGVQKAAEELKEKPKVLFDLASINGKLCLVVREDQMNVPYLFGATMAKGTGEKRVDAHHMADTFAFSFRPAGDKLQFVRLNTRFRADAGSTEAKALADSISDSIVVSLPIVARSTAPAWVAFPAEALFLSDLVDQARNLQEAYPGLHLLSDSSIETLKDFPENMEVGVALHFEGSEKESAALPDGRFVSIKMHYSLAALRKSQEFAPRPADPRIGTFNTDVLDYSAKDLKEVRMPLVSYADRWDLGKKDPNAPVSDVVKPIEWWIDPSVPKEHRDGIRDAVAAINAGLAKPEVAGLRNAIVLKEVDKDMPESERATYDPADMTRNVVAWFMGEGAAYATGPSRANPYTGEIFNANVRVGDLITRVMGGELELASHDRGKSNSQAGRYCDYAESLAERAVFSLKSLEERGALDPAEKKRFMRELVASFVVHEILHTVGLRHNFATRDLLPAPGPGSIADTGYLNDFPTPPSQMAYLPPSIALPGEKQGPYFATQLEDYDLHALHYLYGAVSADPAERKRELEAIASQSAGNPRYAFATDEDADGIDPGVRRHVLGSDPVAYARHQMILAKDLWSRLETRKDSPQRTYASQRESFNSGMNEYAHAVEVVLPVIGGVRSNRVLRPGQGPFIPYDPVSAEEQRRALKFLDENLFDAKALNFSPELLLRMAGDIPTEGPKQPFPLTDVALKVQTEALAHIYAPDTLKRLQDSEIYAAKPGYAMSAAETMDRVRKSIWKELSGQTPAPVALMRRNLQAEHVAVLAKTLINPQVPNDAHAAARRDLERIARDVKRALGSKGLDQATRLHLETIGREVGDVLSEKTLDAASVLGG